MRQIVFIFLLCVSMVHASAAFAADSENAPLRVGVILPLSGPFADYGVATKNGMAMARESTHIDSRVEFIFEDSQYDPKAAVTAYQKLRNIDHVNLIFSWGTGPSQAIAPIAESDHIPLLAMSTEKTLSIGRQYVFRFGCTADAYAEILMQYFRKHGIIHIGVIHDQIAFFEEVIAGLRRRTSEKEQIDIVATLTPSEMDFRSILLKLRNQKFDIVGVFLASNQLTPFFSQMQQFKVSSPMFGTNSLDSRADIQRVGHVMKGTVYPSFAFAKDFHEQYFSRFHDDVQISFAALGYDFILLLEQVVRRAGDSSKSPQVLGALTKVTTVPGKTGLIRFASSAEAGSGFDIPVALLRVTETGVELLKE